MHRPLYLWCLVLAWLHVFALIADLICLPLSVTPFALGAAAWFYFKAASLTKG